MPLSVSNQTEPKNPLKTVVNKTEKVLAPHVTYIFLVCKQANKEKKRSLHYIMISAGKEKNRFLKAETYFGVCDQTGNKRETLLFHFPTL